MDQSASAKTTRSKSRKAVAKKVPVKTRRKKKSAPALPTKPENADDSSPSDEKIANHRRRQASVATILDETFGHLAKCDPDLWERRAYLMLIGMVYERLATCETEIETDELITLAKVLAENRRAEAQVRSATSREAQPETDARTKDTPLPPHLADAVRQIYGTTMPTPETTS